MEKYSVNCFGFHFISHFTLRDKFLNVKNVPEAYNGLGSSSSFQICVARV